MQEFPTIAAISTPLGSGAIGIVRMSGPDAINICDQVFRSPKEKRLSDADSHTIHYGVILSPKDGSRVDEALVSLMRGPATYTREDIVEVNCHGGAVAQQKMLSLFLSLGARLATPGEFTRRAFLNGRIDLAQAESVAQIISAKTEAGLKVAMAQLEGSLSQRVTALRRGILQVLAGVEARVDFSDEDIEELDKAQVAEELARIAGEIRELVDSAFAGRVLTHGVRTAIIGKPNVGKSSLLNALLMRERAIVTEVPGTTRDTIEEIINVEGIPLKLIDTAGLRPAADEVEQIGVERTRRAVQEADLIICMFDGSEPEDDHDRALLTSIPAEKTIYLVNKADKFRGQQPRFNRGLLPKEPIIASAMTRQGLKDLKEKAARLILGGALPPIEGPIVSQERHRCLLAATDNSLKLAQQALRVGLGEELVAEELRSAINSLGEITGEEIVEDLLDVIFREFCIGK